MALLPSKARPAAPWAARNAGDDYGAHAQPDWRQIDWRPHLRSTEIAGRGVRYVDIGSGDGPPIVFVHGLAGVWQNWLENIPRFAQERRGVVPPPPGVGGGAGAPPRKPISPPPGLLPAPPAHLHLRAGGAPAEALCGVC